MTRRELFTDATATFSFAGLCLAASSASAVAGDTALLLQDGTPVRMRLGRNLSSETAQEGESVDFEVLDEVKVGNVVVVAQGATAMATVTEAKHKRTMGRAGHLNVEIDYVRAVSGEKIPLRGIQDAKAGGHVGAMTGAIVATSIIFFPAAPLFLFMHGKDITIPKGHEVTCYVNADFKIDPAKFAPATTAAPATQSSAPKPSGKPLTNDDVITLKTAGFTDDLLIAKIKAAPAGYKTETGDLVALKKAGLSDAVISAMIDATRR